VPDLNHLIVWCADKRVGAAHLVEILGLNSPRDFRGPIDHWADPSKRTLGEINHHDGGKGVYWNDPDGHLLEIITKPYRAETEASGG
jgi:catechol 2,3-dioxygenase-like lactoylglutathione lyase family enzyme